MRQQCALCFLTLLFYTSTTNAAFDSVLWSSSSSSDAMNDESVADIISSSSSPVIIYAMDGFNLAKFSKQMNVYGDSRPTSSALSTNIRASKNLRTQPIDAPIQIPPDSIVHTVAEANGKAFAVFELSTWEELEALVPQIAENLPKDVGYTAILSAKDAFSTAPVEEIHRRKKRVSVSSDVNFDNEEEEDAAANKPKHHSKAKQQQQQLQSSKFVKAAEPMKFSLPVVLPPVHINGSGFIATRKDYCLLYMEAVNIVVSRHEKNEQPIFRNLVIGAMNGSNTFSWHPKFVSCNVSNHTVGIAEFQIHINIKNGAVAKYDKKPVFEIKARQTIAFKLTFNGTYTGYWKLVRLEMLKPLNISQVPGDTSFLTQDITLNEGSNTTAVRFMGVESFYQYAYACSVTQAAFMVVNDNYMVGITLNNIEVDLKAYFDPKKNVTIFNRNVYDCVGTFSVGSWMGIICSLVLASILLFGYLMLQSIQTMDRFDDPKQKQIVINCRE